LTRATIIISIFSNPIQSATANDEIMISQHFIIMAVTPVVIKMRWKWGSEKAIACSSTMTLEEVARDHGFAHPSGALPIFIADGKILSPELTLHWHRVTNGQTIIVYLPNAETPTRASLVSQTPRRFKGSEYYAQDAMREAGRVVDIGFRKWENNRSFPRVLRQIYNQELAEEGQPPRACASTVVTPSPGICDEPLPELHTAKQTLCVIPRLKRTDSV
jgi:hypothetical protein